MLQYKVYQDHNKGKVIADSFSFCVHNIWFILNVLSIYVNNGKLLGKMYMEGSCMTKSGINIALRCSRAKVQISVKTNICSFP